MKNILTAVRGEGGHARDYTDSSPVRHDRFPPMLFRFELEGVDCDTLTVRHIKSAIDLPEVAAITEAVHVNDVHPFRNSDPEAKAHYNRPNIYQTRIGAYYIYIPDTDDNRAIVKVANTKG